MRLKTVLFVSAVAVFVVSPAEAYQNYIPLGAGYSTNVSSLPALNSDAQALTSQTDIYESELYRKQLERHQHDSYINQFFSNTDSSAPDFSVRY